MNKQDPTYIKNIKMLFIQKVLIIMKKEKIN